MDEQSEWDKLDETQRKWSRWFVVIQSVLFVFATLLSLAFASGVIWVVYRVLLHFGIL